MKLSWNATVGNQRSVNNTNYVQGHIKIDKQTNRSMVDTHFSTLSLAPQELVSYILDFNQKTLYLKQKDSCKFYDIIHNINLGEFEIEKLPNIAELLDLFPYVMFYNRTIQDYYPEKDMHEFKYSYPLSRKGDKDIEDSQLLAYFQAGTMELDRLIVRANSLNITQPFTLYASQPVTATKFEPSDMEFKGVRCTKATQLDQ